MQSAGVIARGGSREWPAARTETPLTIALVLLLVGAPAVSVTAADWADHLSWLPVFSAAGALFALFLSQRRLSAPVAHYIGLAFGVLGVAVYFASTAEKGTWLERGRWLTERVGAWLDLAVSGGASSDTLPFSLTMCLLAWFLGYASGWFVFRERAPWWAIVPNAAAVLLNLSYAPPELLPFLFVFLLAALLLLVDLTLQRPRELEHAGVAVAGAGHANPAVLIAGALLSALLLGAAWTLPSGNVHQLISDTWYNMTGPWQNFQNHFDRLFAALNAPERSGRGLNFSRTMAPRAAFELGEQPVLAIAAREPRYWRAATYDRYSGSVFDSTQPSSTRLEADEPRKPGQETYEARIELEQRVQLLASQTSMLFAADNPERANLPTFYDYRDVTDDFAALRLHTPLRRGQQYTVVSNVSMASVNELRAASGPYPDWVRARYLQLPEGNRQVPARVREEARRVAASAETPYDKAIAIESYLRGFQYSTRVKQPPPDRDWVEYMLFESKEGYCDYFATAMVVMLRAVGVPARVASGFAPGDRDPSGEFIVVRESHAHSWTEVYFPSFGWITFEPSALRPVPPRVESTLLDGSLALDFFGFEEEDFGDLDLEGLRGMLPPTDNGSGSSGPDLTWLGTLLLQVLGGLAALLMVLTLVALAFTVSWQRSLRSLREHVRPYAQLCAVAAWCGLARRPSDTPYEYAAALGRELPPLRGEIGAIAEAYVRGTYAREAPERSLIQRAVAAWQQARWLLARTLLRRNWRHLARHLSSWRPTA